MELCGPSFKTMTSLRFIGLQKRTIRSYKLALSGFFEYLDDENISLPKTYHELDNLLASYIELMYLDDRPVTYAGHLLSALKRFFPRVRHHIPLAKQYFVNWKSSQRISQAVPMPAIVCMSLASVAHAARNTPLAALLLLSYLALLRTGEIATLRMSNLSWDTSSHIIIVALPNTKTARAAAESVLVKDPYLPYLLEYIKRNYSTDRLWPGSVPAFRKALRLLCAHLGVQDYNFTPYSIRRGGASQAFASGITFDSLLQRGRWQSIKTARIYLDSGRAALVQQQFPVTLMAQMHHLSHSLTAFCEQLRRKRKS